MTADREQVRRDAEEWLDIDTHQTNCGPVELAQDCLALLAELEQAERERDEALKWQPFAESNLEAIKRLEPRLAKVPALVEALQEAKDALSDVSLMMESENEGWQERAYRRVCDEWNRAREALAAWEQE